jgi:hypothetical protein
VRQRFVNEISIEKKLAEVRLTRSWLSPSVAGPEVESPESVQAIAGEVYPRATFPVRVRTLR